MATATDATREQHEEQSAVDGSPSAVPSSDAGEPSAAVSNRAVELTGVDGSRLRHQRSLHPPLYPSNLLTSSAVYISRLHHTTRPPPLSPALLYRHTTIAVSVFSLDPSVSVRFRRGDPSGGACGPHDARGARAAWLTQCSTQHGLVECCWCVVDCHKLMASSLWPLSPTPPSPLASSLPPCLPLCHHTFLCHHVATGLLPLHTT